MKSLRRTPIFVLCSLLILLVVSAASLQPAQADQEPLLPGAKFLLAQTGIDLMTDRLVDFVVLSLLTTPIDDVKGVVKVAIIGEVEYAMTDITISSAEIKGFGAVLQAPNMVNVQEDSISIGLSLNWSYQQVKFPRAKGSGDATGSAKDAIINCVIAVENIGNKPHLSIVSDNVDLGEMDIKIRGGTSGWVLDLLKSLFKNQIRDAANKAIRKALVDAIDVKFNELVAGMTFIFPLLNSGLAVDARIAGDIVVTDRGFLAVGSKAAVLDIGRPQEPPYTPAKLPSELTIPGTEFNLFISEYPVLSAGFAALSAELFERTITPDMIPSSSPIQLDTTSLRFTLPDLHQKYPDRDIVLKTHVSSPPLAKVTPSGMGAAMNATISFFIIKDDQNLEQVFDINFGAVPFIDKFNVVSDKDGRVLNVTGHVSAFGVDGRLVKSYMGEIDVSKFINLIKLLANSGLLSYVNNLIGPGYPVVLPEGLTVTDATVKLENGYVALAGNVDYLPPVKSASEKRNERIMAILKQIDLYNSRINALNGMMQEVIEMEM